MTDSRQRHLTSRRYLTVHCSSQGPFEKGQELADKVNSGEELTWDDLDKRKLERNVPPLHRQVTFTRHYGCRTATAKGITDLSMQVQSDSYASAFARLASGQVDVLVTYADARRDYEENWTSEVRPLRFHLGGDERHRRDRSDLQRYCLCEQDLSVHG